MKISLQTIKQVKYEVDISNESSVFELKKLIEAKHGFDHTVMKLLHKGKILEDNKLLSEYQFNDGTPVIIMNVKAKAQNVTVASESNETKEESKKAEHNFSKPSIPSNQNNSLLPSKTKDYSKELKQLKEMGFDNEQSEIALKAANGNLTLAIEYLYSGNPLVGNYHGDEDDEEYGLGPEDEEGEEDEDDVMGEELDAYEIEDVASVIKVISKNDPTQLQFILTNLEAQSPDLFDIISQNEEEFKVLVAQPITQKDQQVYDNFIKKNGGSLIALLGNMPGNNPNNEINNSNNNFNSGNSNNLKNTLSSKDLEAIQRLVALGFSEDECMEAYLACGKDENLAASYLFDNKN